MRILVRVTLLAVMAVVFGQARAQVLSNQPAPAQLSSAASVMELAPDIAEKRLPAQITGIVTCSDSGTSLFFVQDATAGIYVYTVQPLPPLGTRVQVTGTTAKGLFSPILMVDGIKALGKAELPPPAPMAVEQLATGRMDSQWVEVEGIVLRQFEHWGHIVLVIGSGSSKLEVRILQADTVRGSNWVDARVKVKGVAGTAYNDRRQFTGFHLLTQNADLVTVIEKAPADPFAAELRLSKNMMAYSRKGAAEHRMRLRGVVTLYWPGKDFYIRDDAGGVQIHSRQETPLKAGDIVEVVGFPAVGRIRPALREALYRKVGEGNEPAPRTIVAKEALSGEVEGEAVSIEGTVLQANETHIGYSALVLEANHTVFSACYLPTWKDGKDESLVGGRVRVTGISVVDPAPQGPSETFCILLRRPEDFTILSRPPAWRQKQILYAISGLGAFVIFGGTWVMLLRLRVRTQTEAIRKREHALEERYYDLFENSNDVIYAHDLDGKITSMNNAGQAILGYTLGELKRMNIADLVEPDDLEKARGQTKAKLDGALRTAYELRVRGKNGHRLIFEVNSRLFLVDGAAAGVQGIARDITARKKADEALRLSERQLRASLDERERLGRDLHDGIIQSIYAAGLNIDDCARIVTKEPDAVERRLRKVMGDLNRVIRDVRDFIVGLERHRLKGAEFKAALKSLALTIGESQSTRIELTVDESAAAELDSAQATQLLHIAREGLSNSIRHAHAQKVVFTLGRAESGIHFEISDDGIGFNPAACEGKGYGLRNMASRAKDLNASFQLLSQTGEGTRIVLDIGQEAPEESLRENPLAHRR